MKPPRPTDTGVHACRNCDQTCAEDRFCEGCAAFICEACDKNPVTTFDHEPAEHGSCGYQAEICDSNADDENDSL